jgi:hypothetical protein
MTPKFFKEADVELKKPANMTDEECSSLWIHRTDGQCISLWKTTLWERVKFLFHGHIWIGVLSGETQPPIWLDCNKTTFKEEKEV